MYPRIQKAMRDALALVRQSKVKDATEVIRAALNGNVAERPVQKKKSGKRLTPSRIVPSLSTRSDVKPTSLLGWQPRLDTRVPDHDDNGHFGEADQTFSPRIFRHRERPLNYMIYIPKNDSRHPRSILLMLHGCNQDPVDFAIGTEMNKYADQYNFVVAYPQQPKTANSLGCWNWFEPRHQKRGAGEPSMLADLAEELRDEFGVSKQRVFVAGLSAGGAMAEILATEYPDQFAAAGIHSGLPYGAANSVATAFAAMRRVGKAAAPKKRLVGANVARRIVFHGAKDATVHPSNGAQIVNQARARTANLNETKLQDEVNGVKFERTNFETSDGTTQVEYWEILGGGHAWSGGSRGGSFTASSGPNASEEMLRFFSEEEQLTKRY